MWVMPLAASARETSSVASGLTVEQSQARLDESYATTTWEVGGRTTAWVPALQK